MGNPEFVADDSSISSTGLLSELVRYIDQVEADYKAIEREILSTDDMPAEFAEWSAPANTMRWGDKLRARLKDLSDNVKAHESSEQSTKENNE